MYRIITAMINRQVAKILQGQRILGMKNDPNRKKKDFLTKRAAEFQSMVERGVKTHQCKKWLQYWIVNWKELVKER